MKYIENNLYLFFILGFLIVLLLLFSFYSSSQSNESQSNNFNNSQENTEKDNSTNINNSQNIDDYSQTQQLIIEDSVSFNTTNYRCVRQEEITNDVQIVILTPELIHEKFEKQPSESFYTHTNKYTRKSIGNCSWVNSSINEEEFVNLQKLFLNNSNFKCSEYNQSFTKDIPLVDVCSKDYADTLLEEERDHIIENEIN